MFVRAAAVNRELTAKELAAAIREERKARKQLLRQNATEEGRKALVCNDRYLVSYQWRSD